jgi:hypothetical protein
MELREAKPDFAAGARTGFVIAALTMVATFEDAKATVGLETLQRLARIARAALEPPEPPTWPGGSA